MSFHPVSNAREPLHHINQPANDNNGSSRIPLKQHYQPPAPQSQHSAALNVHANPLLMDDAAFLAAAESLVNKRQTRGLSGAKYIYSKMDPLKRSQFADAYSRRYRRMPMFPSPDETLLQRWMRRIEDDFGNAFLQVLPSGDEHVGNQHPKQSETTNQVNHPNQQDWYRPPNPLGEKPVSTQHQRDIPQMQTGVRYCNEHPAYSNYSLVQDTYDAEPSRPSQRQYSRKVVPRQVEYNEPSDARNSVRVYTPTSILRKARLTRNPVAQIMEVLPPAASPVPTTTIASDSLPTSNLNSLVRNQSTTRQRLMEEIHYVHHLMETSRGGNDAYASHLGSLKTQLQRLTGGGETLHETNESGILEIDRVLPPSENQKSDIVIVDMEEIKDVNKKERRSWSPRRNTNIGRRHKSPRRSRSRSKERTEVRKSNTNNALLEAAIPVSPRQQDTRDPVIPKVVVIDRSLVSNFHIPKCDDEPSNSVVDREPNQQHPPSTVQVVAPANLPPGYQLDAQFDKEIFKVTVPAGGVSKGQIFEGTSMKAGDKSKVHLNASESTWNAGLFDCLAYGIAHPLFVHSFFCPQSKFLPSD